MQQVLMGFAVVVIVIGLGYLLARHQVLGKNAAPVLGSFVYHVALPALLLRTLLHYDLSSIFSRNFLVIMLSAWLVALLFFLLSYYYWHHRADTALIGMLAASYANSSNLGIPLAAYVVGNVDLVVPLLIFQVGIYTPLAMTLLDLLHTRERIRWRTIVLTPLHNPLFMAAIVGAFIGWLPVGLPQVLDDVVNMIAGASVPLALIVFGMSLAGVRLFDKTANAPKEIWVAVFAKNLLHPAVAGALAWTLGLQGQALAAAVFLGALPTAQNVYAYALQHRTAQTFARDVGVVSTIVSLPILAAIAIFFGMA